MTRDEAVDTIMRRLGNWPNTSLRDTIISEMVVVIQNVLEQDPVFLPWFLISEVHTGPTEAGEERVLLPTGFLQEYENGALYILDDGNETPLLRDDLDVIKQRAPGTGLPTYYDIVGNYFILRKIPDAIYSLKIRFYKSDDTAISGTYGDSNNKESKWLKWAADLVIAETGTVIAGQYLQSKSMEESFARQAVKARSRLVAKSTLMEETNKQRFMEG